MLDDFDIEKKMKYFFAKNEMPFKYHVFNIYQRATE